MKLAWRQLAGGAVLGLAVIGSASAQDGAAELTERERAFTELLADVELVGFFTDSNAPADRPLTKDKYSIAKVSKVEGNVWRFDAKIEYGGQAMTIPLALPVEWAGDTPMISLTDQAIPGFGTFTARVLFYGDQYAGIWSGANHYGEMFGKIVKSKPSEPAGDEGPPAVNRGNEPVEQQQTTQNWPSFHGTGGRGVSEGFELPVTWDPITEENIRWSVEVPGLSHSSPVIWDDRVFVTSALPVSEETSELKIGLYGDIGSVENEVEHEFLVACFDFESGEELWSDTAYIGVPAIKRHPKGSHAASTPATDGEYVVAFFASEGLYCYTTEGDLVWSRDFGVLDSGYYMVPDAQWGFASSPVIHADRVIIQVDVQENSFVAALDLATGEDVWRTARDEVPTWSTPTIVEVNGQTQVICNGYKHIGAYDFATGAEIWKMPGGGDIPVPTPIVAHDTIFITNNHGRMGPVFAIDVAATGELKHKPEECEFMRWSDLGRRGNYMQTPLVVGSELYLCADSGALTCVDALTGKQHYRNRLGSGFAGFTGSGVAGDGKLYFTSEDGETSVVKAGPEFEIIQQNSLGEKCLSTPAISRGCLLFRTEHHLICVGNEENTDQ